MSEDLLECRPRQITQVAAAEGNVLHRDWRRTTGGARLERREVHVQD
jgi:hypothetical protein